MQYVEYAAERIAEAFQLSEEERRQLLDFRDTMKRFLLEAQRQAKEKLTALYKAVTEGTYRMERNRLYVSDDMWMYIGKTTRVSIRGVSAVMHFPDVLKLPQEKLELFQLGWRASDEDEKNGRPAMSTTQPWQAFAWTAVRYGKLYVRIVSANLTREGASIMIRIIARSWKQRWGNNKPYLIASHFRSGEWSPILTAWLGDGQAYRRGVLCGDYQLVIVAKEPWRLGKRVGAEKVLVATGKEAFVKLKEAAGAYGELQDLLKAHKWILVKLAADDGFRAAYKLNRKRSVDILREAYKHNNSEIPTEQFSEADIQRRDAIVVAGVVMYLHLHNNRGGSLFARRYVRNVEKALSMAERLESAGLRPNVIPAGSYYMVYIATADLLKLAERDETIRKAIALFLAEKAKNGTPREREAAEKILKRHPFFLTLSTVVC
jgi:hypothetical protein